jgi:hypothetical protein
MLGKTTKLLLAGMLVASLGLTQVASATHVRPKGATPLRDSLVVAQKACTAPNSSHGAPLLLPSCNPPLQASQFVTVGTPDANGAGANLIGFVKLTITAADVLVLSSSTDVRCLPATAASVCPFANAFDGPDYTGELQLEIGLRITDHFSNPGPTTPATAADVIYPVKLACVDTMGTTSVGSTCGINSSFNAIVPGSAPAGKRSVYEIPQRAPVGGIQVYDGGPSGIAGSTNATLFLEPGVFLP